MSLGVAQLEVDVGQPRSSREPTSSLEHRRRAVHSHRLPLRGQAPRLARRLSGSAPDVEDVITGTDSVHSPQRRGEALQLGVVVDGPIPTFGPLAARRTRHFSNLCDEPGLQPTVFYRWQKESFKNGAAAFDRTE